jgi:very-short-patch-repair endonuclease
MREGKPNFMQLKNKQNDMIKNWVAKNAGYKLIRIWEKDIEEDYEGIKNKITNIISEIDGVDK